MDSDYLYKDFGVLTVVEFSHKKGFRKFFLCRCNKCGSPTRVRTDHLRKLPKSCGSCVNQLQKEIALEKYDPIETKFNSLYSHYRTGANNRALVFDISKEQFSLLRENPCYYCGDIGYGLDRIDSNLGYTINNVVSCCSICNIMKNKFTQDVFFEKISKIYNKHLK